MIDPATKDDIRAVRGELKDAVRELKDEIRAVGIKVERLDTKVDGVIEGLTSTREELKRDITSVEVRLVDRMTTIEHVVRENSTEIARQSEEIRRLTGDTRSLHQQVLGLRVDLTNGLAKNEADHATLDARMSELEKKLGVKPS